MTEQVDALDRNGNIIFVDFDEWLKNKALYDYRLSKYMRNRDYNKEKI